MAAAPPPIPPPPNSGVRRQTDDETLKRLSADGLAAVILHARALFKRERCAAPHLTPTDLRGFVATVTRRAKEMKTGVYVKEQVYVAPLYEAMRAAGDIEGLSFDAFKSRLLQALHRGQIMLSKAYVLSRKERAMVHASAIEDGEFTVHVLHRAPSVCLQETLNDIQCGLSKDARANVMDFARRVLRDERLRDGGPRLVTLTLPAFAARVQAIVNRGTSDASIGEVFRRLSEGGNATAMNVEEFEARVLAASRAELLTVIDAGMAGKVVRWAAPGPIPWGPPPRVVGPGRVEAVA